MGEGLVRAEDITGGGNCLPYSVLYTADPRSRGVLSCVEAVRVWSPSRHSAATTPERDLSGTPSSHDSGPTVTQADLDQARQGVAVAPEGQEHARCGGPDAVVEPCQLSRVRHLGASCVEGWWDAKMQ